MSQSRLIRKATRRPRVSPLRYPGGKAALYPRLRELIRASGLAGCTYIEPYAGGAGAGISLLISGQVERVVINDLDPAIYAFWTTVVNEPEFLISRIMSIDLGVAEWHHQKAVYVKKDLSDIPALGFATFYLNRTNRSGVLNGGPIGGLDQSGKYKIDARFNREGLIKRLRSIELYCDSIVPSCKDGLEVINEYAGCDGTFIYADPPYFEKAGSLYMNTFKADHHRALAAVLNSYSDASWVLTYDNVDRVDELYSDRRRRRFELNYSAHRVMKATEVAVLSDAVEDIAEGWPVVIHQ